MRDDQVQDLARRVMTLGTWSDAAADELMSALSKLTDFRAAQSAVDELVETWDTGFRPPIARLRTMYQSKAEAWRQVDEFDRPRPSFRIPTMEEGREIAWRSYVQDCHERGIPVSKEKFDAFMSSLGLPKPELEPEPTVKVPGGQAPAEPEF